MRKLLVGLLSIFGNFFAFLYQTTCVVIREPPAFRLIRDQMWSIGVTSIPVISVSGFATGMVLAAQSIFQLSDYGLETTTGLMVTKAMVVELGPVLTAFMITGRVGAAMCAELGTMQVTEQIDALRSMAVNPLRYLVAPRFTAGSIMIPLLTIYSCVMGSIGGFFVAVHYYGMSPNEYLAPLPRYVKNFDLLSGLVKSTLFGMLIVSISCYRGLSTRGGAQGVGRSTTNSVVICYTAILIVNFFVTVALNASHDFLINNFGSWL